MRLLKAQYDPEQKGYNCANCQSLFINSSGKMRPACLSRPSKCPVDDIAPDIKLNKKMVAFLQAEQFDMMPGYADWQRKLLKEAGFDDETPETIIALKIALREGQQGIANQKKNEDAHARARAVPQPFKKKGAGAKPPQG